MKGDMFGTNGLVLLLLGLLFLFTLMGIFYFRQVNNAPAYAPAATSTTTTIITSSDLELAPR